MTTRSQRDRLAAVLLEAAAGRDDPPLMEMADLLLSRGVRVIDERLLDEVTLNRCMTDEAAAGCESCQRAAMELVAFLNDEDPDDD